MLSAGTPRRLPLEQVSALCVRSGAGGDDDLVAVGDEEFAVVTAPLRDGGLGADDRHELVDVVAENRGKCDWEAAGTDGARRLFLIEEESADVIVVAADLREQVHTIHLRASDGPDERAEKLLAGDNKGPEGMVLLTGGHLLVCKQRKPVLLVEFGPRDDDPRGFAPDAAPGRDEAFALSRGDETDLFPLRSWRLVDEDDLKSANDLAFDDEGRLHAISSRSCCIYEITPDAGGDEIQAGARWPLPAGVGADPDEDRNAEGLAFDRFGRPIVALDVKDTHDNLVLLEALPR